VNDTSQTSRTEAAEWLARRDRGPWSEADQAALDAWLAQSWSNATAFWRLDAAWARANRLGAVRRAPGNRLLQAVSGRFMPTLFRSAAAALVVAAVAGAAFYTLQPGERSYETTIGGHETLTLDNGTKVELNTDTKVRVSLDRRKVWLERGEAYFDVVHDAARPFMVMVGDHRVTDIGTKFLVRQNESRIEVSLFEGRAKLDSTSEWAPQHSAMLMPGDVAVATANSMLVMKMPEKTLSSELGWRRGVLIFKHASLAEAAAEFNRYNHEKLDVRDPQIARLKIDGTFRIDNTHGFLNMAQRVLGLQIMQRGERIVISR